MCDLAAGFKGMSSWNCKNGRPSSGSVCSSNNVTSWEGVYCDSDFNVIEIFLYNSSLTGTLSTSIGFLTSLQYLIFDSDQLSGTIPTTIGYLTALYNLDLGYNRFTGTLPTTLGLLTALDYVILDENQLSGSIPSEIGSMSSIYYLSVSYNKLNGTIPTAIGLMTSLFYLDVTYNSLTGDVPYQLCLLTELENNTFIYRNNSLTCSSTCSYGDTEYCISPSTPSYYPIWIPTVETTGKLLEFLFQILIIYISWL